MQESEFDQRVDAIYLKLEEAIDTAAADLDYETSAGVLTITCENDGSKIILSRQRASREIWIAARSGGFHFHFADGQWQSAVGETLTQALARITADQAGKTIEVHF